MFIECTSAVCRAMYEVACIFNGTQPCTRDANSTSSSYDTDDNSFFRECECRTSAEKKRSLTRDISPVHSRISRTKVDLLCDLFPGFSLARLHLQFKNATYVRDSFFLRQKGRRKAPSHLTLPEKVLREKPHISRPANLKILKSTFPAARVMAPDDC